MVASSSRVDAYCPHEEEAAPAGREEAKARKALLRQQESMAKMQKLENERLRDILKTLDKIRDRHQKIKVSIQGLQEEDKFNLNLNETITSISVNKGSLKL